MRTGHWLGIIVVAAIFYLVGVKFPTYGQSALSAVGV